MSDNAPLTVVVEPGVVALLRAAVRQPSSTSRLPR